MLIVAVNSTELTYFQCWCVELIIPCSCITISILKGPLWAIFCFTFWTAHLKQIGQRVTIPMGKEKGKLGHTYLKPGSWCQLSWHLDRCTFHWKLPLKFGSSLLNASMPNVPTSLILLSCIPTHTHVTLFSWCSLKEAGDKILEYFQVKFDFPQC